MESKQLFPQRYGYIELIGKGGMGSVFRVYDQLMKREVAIKVMSSELSEYLDQIRFMDEIQVTAQLEHPGIVPVYDTGQFNDHVYYTMKFVRGTSWKDELAGVKRDDSVNVRNSIRILEMVCNAIAYAHDRSVIHRDLKPDNVMLGQFGEVFVVDWGLAKAQEVATRSNDSRVVTSLPENLQTQYGSVNGTFEYMPPEQAKGQHEKIGPHSDVYALGAILFEILSGHPPFGDGLSVQEIYLKLVQDEVPLDFSNFVHVPDGLRVIALECLHADINERPAHAGIVAEKLRTWLSGEQTRDHAIKIVEEASLRLQEAQALREKADHAREQFVEASKRLHPLATIDEKRSVWRLEDESQELLQLAAHSDIALTEQAESALRLVEDLPEAHMLLANHYRRLHERMDGNDAEATLRFERKLENHDRKDAHAVYLKGMGTLTLHTNPSGANVVLYKYEEQERRLIPVNMGTIGLTPICDLPIELGSYLLEVKHPAHEIVRYPVQIRRLEHWDGCPPGSSEPNPVCLPKLGELGPNQIYVPQGWAEFGGDDFAPNAISSRRNWIDGFVIDKFPVTCAEYIVFLNSLVDSGNEEGAIAGWPPLSYWEAKAPEAERADQWIDRNREGRFWLRQGQPNWPITLVNWAQSYAYTQNRGKQEGLPWRLCGEMEWEKAARGVDGRFFPWGNRYVSGAAHNRDIAAVVDGRPLKCGVNDYPMDESPYGVSGLAGNVRDWCQDAGELHGPAVVNGRPIISDGENLKGPGLGGVFRIHKGGCWNVGEEGSRGAYRDGPPAIFSDTSIGFRCARRWPTTT